MLCYYSPDGNPYLEYAKWASIHISIKKLNGEKGTCYHACLISQKADY